jgi:hypothetical protein
MPSSNTASGWGGVIADLAAKQQVAGITPRGDCEPRKTSVGAGSS